MANPWLDTKWDAPTGGMETQTFFIDASTITYDATKTGGSTQVGLAVKKKAGTAKTVELTTANSHVLGLLLGVAKDGACTVQIAGRARMKAGANMSAAATAEGKAIVGDVNGSAQ